MDDLEKKLNKLPRPKLSLKADLKIKSKLYYFIITNKLVSYQYSFSIKRPAFRATIALFLIMIIVFSGTSIYAYGSKSIMPGSKLYNLKQAVENVEEKLTFTPAAKVELYEKFSQRRLEEALYLSENELPKTIAAEKEKINEEIKKTIDTALTNLDSAVSASQGISENQKNREVEVKENVNAREDIKIQYLNKIETNAEAENNDKLVRQASEAKEEVKKYKKLIADKKVRKDSRKKESIENAATTTELENNKSEATNAANDDSQRLATTTEKTINAKYNESKFKKLREDFNNLFRNKDQKSKNKKQEIQNLESVAPIIIENETKMPEIKNQELSDSDDEDLSISEFEEENIKPEKIEHDASR